MSDIDAVLARVRDITQGDGAKIAAHIDAQAAEIAELRARVEALEAALREARAYVKSAATFQADTRAQSVLCDVDAALAGKE